MQNFFIVNIILDVQFLMLTNSYLNKQVNTQANNALKLVTTNSNAVLSSSSSNASTPSPTPSRGSTSVQVKF